MPYLITGRALSARENRLRTKLLALLQAQGFTFDDEYAVHQQNYSKEEIRKIHTFTRQERLNEERPFVEKWLSRLSKYLACGSEVTPSLIRPVPILVEDNEEWAALFRLACLWWSVPVSRGFGRRFRLLIFDESNNKLLGLLGLTDPVFNLNARDSFVGWNSGDREKRLAHVMDAYVLGAVPPYNRLLGAKLIALLCASDFMRELFARKYKGTKSVILEREFDGRLAMVTATSALGRSSVYNRLKYDGVEVFQAVGFSEGYGHFHLANGTYRKLKDHLTIIGDAEVNRYRFGSGPNYRIRIVRRALECLGLPREILRHGVRRAVHVAPLARNVSAFLRGSNTRLQWYSRPLDEVIETWRDRWLLPRAGRDDSYRQFRQESWQQILDINDKHSSEE